MSRNRFTGIQCSLARALNEAGDWWTFLIVRDALRGVQSFHEFHASLGIARNILTLRLGQLCDDGLMTRTAHPDDRRRIRYQLTEKGQGLAPALVALMQWGDRWISGADNAPVILRNKGTGVPLRDLELSDANGALVSPVGFRFTPGPGILGADVTPNHVSRDHE